MSFDITTRYDSIFNGIDFWAQDPVQLPKYEENTVQYHHDGGDDNTVILMGDKPATLELTAGCYVTEMEALKDARGTSGSLSYPGLSYAVTARLIGAQATVNPLDSNLYTVRLSFLI